jgi:hypothetical protein
LEDDAEEVSRKAASGVEDTVEIESELSKLQGNQSERDSYLRLISMKRGILTQILRQGR